MSLKGWRYMTSFLIRIYSRWDGMKGWGHRRFFSLKHWIKSNKESYKESLFFNRKSLESLNQRNQKVSFFYSYFVALKIISIFFSNRVSHDRISYSHMRSLFIYIDDLNYFIYILLIWTIRTLLKCISYR